MTTIEFEQHVSANAKPDLDFNYAVIGMCGETGEVAEFHKKYHLRGNVIGLHIDELKGELGDVLFYLTRATMLNGWSLAEVMLHNKRKLDDRKGKGLRQIV